MRLLNRAGMPCLILSLASGAALAQELDAETTIDLVEPLALPQSAAEEGVVHSAFGIGTANENRAQAAERRAAGMEQETANRQAESDVAAAARERRAEAGEAARDARADLVRGDAALGLTIPAGMPSLPVDAPVTPSVPERPAVPAGPGGA